MSERPNREESNILEVAEQLLEEQHLSEFTKEYPSRQPIPLRGYLGTPYDIPSLIDIKLRNWLELANRARNLPQTEFFDEITELKHDMDYLRLRHRVLEKELAIVKEENIRLSKQMQELQSLVRTGIATLSDLSKVYIDMVSEIEIVQQVLIEETVDTINVWTIIDAPPFEDSLRTPIYDAQINNCN